MQEPLNLTKIKSLIDQNRTGAGEFALVEGLHAIKHTLRFKAKPKIIITQNKADLLKLSQKLCPDITPLLKKESQELANFDQLTDSKIRTAVLGIFYKPQKTLPLPKQSSNEDSIENHTILLDNPKDLSNIGAVIRVCAAAGIQQLILTGSSNPWNATAIRAAAGLQFALNIHQIKNTPTFLSKGILSPESKSPILISFDERGEDLSTKLKAQIPANAILVFGSERDGISQELKLKSQKIIRLPMQIGVSSMNLATSVAAALYSLKI